MSPHPTSIVASALGALAVACASHGDALRRDNLPPPAPVIQAGIRTPGAGLDAGIASPRVHNVRLPHEEAVRRAIGTASSLVRHRDIVVAGVRWGQGCAALVRAAFAEAGAPFPEDARDVAALHALTRTRGETHRGRPVPGDLAFLADRPGGPPEHVGLVASVAPNGTALVLHQTEHGVLRVRVNGAHPWKLRADSGRALNDSVVVGAGRISAGRLLVAYATVL